MAKFNFKKKNTRAKREKYLRQMSLRGPSLKSSSKPVKGRPGDMLSRAVGKSPDRRSNASALET